MKQNGETEKIHNGSEGREENQVSKEEVCGGKLLERQMTQRRPEVRSSGEEGDRHMAKGTVNNARKFQSFLDDGGSGGYPGHAERAQESLGTCLLPSLDSSRPLTRDYHYHD